MKKDNSSFTNAKIRILIELYDKKQINYGKSI